MADETRDRVRALVREVLAKSIPHDVATESQTPSRFVQVAPESQPNTTVTRDESSKSIITEDDVRGLESGAVLRIGQDARLTPLAASPETTQPGSEQPPSPAEMPEPTDD